MIAAGIYSSRGKIIKIYDSNLKFVFLGMQGRIQTEQNGEGCVVIFNSLVGGGGSIIVTLILNIAKNVLSCYSPLRILLYL